jgi:hypothetical protein
VEIAETIRNASENIDSECDEWIAEMCLVQLRKNPSFLKKMDQGQLLGGLQESLEEQYQLYEFNYQYMQKFQATMFTLLSEIIGITNKKHAIDIIDFIPADYIENVILKSSKSVILHLLKILSFSLECHEPSNVSKICFKPIVIKSLLSDYEYDTFETKVQLVKFISILTKYASLEIIDVILENDYIQNFISVLGTEECILDFLLSIKAMINFYPVGDNPVIKCLQDASFKDYVDEINEEDSQICELCQDLMSKVYT